MQRRDFLRIAGIAAAGNTLLAQQMQMPMPQSGVQSLFGPNVAPDVAKTEFTLRIAPVTVELAPNKIISTIGYNGTAPGPLMRMKQGVPVTVNVVNESDVPELIHFHGLLNQPDSDGTEEEGTPVVPAQGMRTYRFTPTLAGTRWYHSQQTCGEDLHRGIFTGMFGFLIVEGNGDAGKYDQEHHLALRDWSPYFAEPEADASYADSPGPQTEKPAGKDAGPRGIEVSSEVYSINDKALGEGDPIRVNAGQRVMFRFLNASAIESRHIALPQHRFNVVALDGNPVPTPAAVDVLMLAPGERVDAWVEMNQPGVWVMGAPEDSIRNGGLGIVIEYANQHKTPQWIAPPKSTWDYTIFGKAPSGQTGEPIDMVFEKAPRGSARFDTFTINGKSYPHEQEFVLKQGTRYRLTMHNRTDEAHPMHLHRHQMEIVEIYGKATAGVIKDTLLVPAYGRAVVDFTADQPGLTLLHSTVQQHSDYGLKALLRYA